ncbi:MAG: hypothetical protein ACKVOK_10505, partial [Flavobacteriales bacterium]
DPIEYYKADKSNWLNLLVALESDMGRWLDPQFQDIYKEPIRLKIRLPLLTAPPDCNFLPEYSTAYYFVSKKKSSGRVVLLHQGHYSRGTDRPYRKSSLINRDFIRLLYALLSEGTDVALILMPNSDPCFGTLESKHACFWNSIVTTGSPLKVFLTPAASMMAYLSDRTATKDRAYEQFSMIGLSGGGFISTIYSAIDKRIKTSISVAPGMMPFYLYGTNPIATLFDLDLSNKYVFNKANPQDYYAMASYGSGRNHFEVWLKNDEGGSNGMSFFYGNQPNHICNGQSNRYKHSISYDSAGKEVQDKVSKILGGKGKFEIIIDEPQLKEFDQFKVGFNNGYTGMENYQCPSPGCHLISQDVLTRFLDVTNGRRQRE